ncbi:MAG: biotin/lipoyl-binding protein, partial [Chloroflexota bacterium]|nr:biotin/lipoyl-binding protein [Chloroflexota bacterium]
MSRFVTNLLPSCAVGAALLLAACSSPSSGSTTAAPTIPALTVSEAQATQTSIQQTQSYTGDLRAPGQVSVLPKAVGMIQAMAVDVGSQVKAGDTLAVLDSATAQAQVAQSQAALDQAQAKLAALQVGPRAEDVAVAQATLDQARSKLANLQAGGRTEDVQVAQQTLAAAQAKLDG